ncbi:hypothetical protein [Sphingomonas aracearum]|uniref:DUF3298 domain-containing protein n=1 Tax=Sphingomonas aracearum TaxID=2283317 RepID=A0A369VZY7_9SPHN|nr:hypothetical protein [Sphingomonas aracearum]RDE06680.1 hypothetical protein DVW87_02980 [Sphingomonas aracearum]
MAGALAVLATALLAGSAQPASAGDRAPEPAWAGVWQGQVGSLPVRACLARDGLGGGFGSYYYLSRLRPIRLEQAGGSRVWAEKADRPQGTAGPSWTFATVGPRLLAGSWRYGARRLPFRLTRLAAGDEEPCAGVAFNGPRLRFLRVASTPARLAGESYTRLTFDAGPAFPDVKLESFALTGTDAASVRINARLRELMPASATGSDWYGCITGALASPSGGGDYEARVTPTLITPRWLAATELVGYYCGGAHPDGTNSSLVFDRTTGREVDLHGWLAPGAIDRRDHGVALRSAFRDFLLARAGELEAECRETLNTAEFWDIGLSRAGLSFTPELPHVVAACANPVAVPWAPLSPWLGAAGKAGAATLAGR